MVEYNKKEFLRAKRIDNLAVGEKRSRLSQKFRDEHNMTPMEYMSGYKFQERDNIAIKKADKGLREAKTVKKFLRNEEILVDKGVVEGINPRRKNATIYDILTL